MDTRRQVFTDLRQQYADNTSYKLLESFSDAAWNEIEQYWRKSEDSPAYYAATILDPAQKTKWFKKNWRNQQEWLATALKFCNGAMGGGIQREIHQQNSLTSD
jgi:hypothetical protein